MKSVHNKGRSGKRFSLPRRYILAGLVTCLSGALILGSFIFGATQRERAIDYVAQFGLSGQNLLSSIIAAPVNYLHSVFFSPELETLVVDIKFKHIEKVRLSREKALAVNVLNTTGEDFVPATIRHGNRSIDVKMRLKGDNIDHLKGDKWSFRVDVKGSDELFGMRRFSLMNPRVRADQLEPLAFSMLRDMDLLTPKFFYVNLTINGHNHGVMALEEYPTKELLESQGRRESVVLRLDEAQTWKDFELNGYWDKNYNNYATTTLKVAQLAKIQASPKLNADFQIASGLLKGFIRNELPASRVFNVEDMGRYLAAMELLGAGNGFWWANLRFYFNPITARLEPIASDLMSDHTFEDRPSIKGLEEPMIKAMLADESLRQVYLRELRQLAQKVQDGSLVETLKGVEEDLLSSLHKEFPFLQPFDIAGLTQRAEFLLKANNENLEYVDMLVPRKHVVLQHAEIIKNGEQCVLELTNTYAAPVEVIAIRWTRDATEKVKPLDTIEPLQYPLEIPATEVRERPNVQSIAYICPTNVTDADSLEIISRVKGLQETYSVNAFMSYASLRDRPIGEFDLEALLRDHPYIHLVGNDTLAFRAGEHEVSKTLSTPAGYDLTIPAGTRLSFADDAILIVRGALNIAGLAKDPVVLDALASTVEGTKAGWPGIFVLDADSQSSWQHARVLNTTGVANGDWMLTGGVTFYQSKVRLEEVHFESNRAEDALNIVRSEFELVEVSIVDTISDGFDSDFSNGSVTGGLFSNIGTAGGGDGIDISGSSVKVSGTQFSKISDKALSVGEASQMDATLVQIDGAMTGAASKDASKLTITASTIKNAQVAGMMVYVKKPEYGPASIDAEGVDFQNTTTLALAQTGSRIELDGTLVPHEALDVDALYNSFMKKAAPQ